MELLVGIYIPDYCLCVNYIEQGETGFFDAVVFRVVTVIVKVSDQNEPLYIVVWIATARRSGCAELTKHSRYPSQNRKRDRDEDQTRYKLARLDFLMLIFAFEIVRDERFSSWAKGRIQRKLPTLEEFDSLHQFYMIRPIHWILVILVL